MGHGEPERSLADRLRQGDTEAWRRLCEDYGEPLFVYACHRVGGDRHAAEDVRQETLLAAADGIAGYRGQVALFAWLCGIARHKAADRIRQAARENPSLEIRDEVEPGSPWVWTSLGREPFPDEAVERAETRAAITKALWCLPEDYREALILRYLHEESVRWVAGRLGRSYKATESLLSRAREALRRLLVEVGLDEAR